MTSLFSFRLILGIAFSFSTVGITFGAPSVSSLSPRGLQVGGTTEVTIRGSELGPSARIVAPFAVDKQEALAGSTAQQAKLQITLADSAPPGIYPVWIASDAGIAGPVMIGVDRLPQQLFTTDIAELPVALTGAIAGDQFATATFEGRQGESLVIDAEVQRLGANFKPVLRLLNSKGRQVAFSPPRHELGGDARIAVTLPADDRYTLQLHDRLYRAGGPGHFRLKVGQLQYADFALPLAITAGSQTTVHFASTNLPPDATVTIDASQAAIPGGRPGFVAPGQWFTGAQPALVISDGAEVVETAQLPAGSQKQLLPPIACAVTGLLAAKGEEDQFLVPVTAGQKLRIAVHARQLGSMLDSVLIVRNAQGVELARNDDQPGSEDSALEFTVPANTAQLLVGVRDMADRFGPDYIYRLVIRDAAAPDIAATIETTVINVPASGTAVVPVSIGRTNYNGPLRLDVGGLVGEIEVAGNEIPAGANTTLLTLTAKHGQSLASLANIVVRATQPGVELARYVEGPSSGSASSYQPHVRQSLGFAIGPAGPIQIDWDASVEREKTRLGTQLPLAIKLTRRDGTVGNVRLKLLTTQPMPQKKIKENNKDKVVDDLDRALRLASDTPVLAPETNTATIHLEIPGDLPVQDWGIVLVAELLAPDGKTVVASSNTSAQTIRPESP
jgi:hypothetical protein